MSEQLRFRQERNRQRNNVVSQFALFRSRALSEESDSSSKKTVFGLLRKSPKEEKKTFTQVDPDRTHCLCHYTKSCNLQTHRSSPNCQKRKHESVSQELLEKPDLNEDVSPEQQEAYNLLVVKGTVRERGSRDASPSDESRERQKQARERRMRRALEHQKQVRPVFGEFSLLCSLCSLFGHFCLNSFFVAIPIWRSEGSYQMLSSPLPQCDAQNPFCTLCSCVLFALLHPRPCLQATPCLVVYSNMICPFPHRIRQRLPRSRSVLST